MPYGGSVMQSMIGGGISSLAFERRIKELEEELSDLKNKSMVYMRAIKSGEDMNTIVQPGLYDIQSDTAKVVKNLAIAEASVVEVFVAGTYLIQRQNSIFVLK